MDRDRPSHRDIATETEKDTGAEAEAETEAETETETAGYCERQRQGQKDRDRDRGRDRGHRGHEEQRVHGAQAIVELEEVRVALGYEAALPA